MVKIDFNAYGQSDSDCSGNQPQLPLHPSFNAVYKRLQKLQSRFPIFQDESLFRGQSLLYSLATKNFFDHRSTSHLSRLILSIHLMHKELQRVHVSTLHSRCIEIKWIPARLSFPFSTKSVMGCLIGFNLLDCYEVFDEESVLLTLKKDHPEISIAKDSFYHHVLPNKNQKIIYFEIGKKDQTPFSLEERHQLNSDIEKHIGRGFQKRAPTVFMRRNEEEVYKTILTLNREIHSVQDMPQVWITYEQQDKEEAVFLIILVHVALKTTTPIFQRLTATPYNSTFVPERSITVRHLEGHPIEAAVFRVHLPRSLSLVRSDGSLDFYASRREVVTSVKAVVGEFRDFNGGSLIEQLELLDNFKSRFSDLSDTDIELMETFFYGITPLEKQALLRCDALYTLYQHFLMLRNAKFEEGRHYLFDINKTDSETYLAIKMCRSWKVFLLTILEKSEFKDKDFTYTFLEIAEGLFFHAVLPHHCNPLISSLEELFFEREQSVTKRQVLRIGMEHPPLSLDPRIGEEAHSSHILQLLFEGLTRVNKQGKVENGMAEQIEIAPDFKCYVFKLRKAVWNDGSPITAFDFEYAWKKVLTPEFKSPFADLFYPITYAKEAKEGKVSTDMVGIAALDDNTLKVDLTNPTPSFLELTAQSLFYPVREHIDQVDPQWPYQAGEHYPCNGPFQLELNDSAHHTYRLVRNPRYWDTASISLDEILFMQINPYQALEALNRKELDWIATPFGSLYPVYAAREQKPTTVTPDVSGCWLVFNTTCEPFHHHKIRRAFAYGIHREQLIGQTFLALTPAYSVLLPRQNSAQSYPRPRFPKHNIDVARVLFQEALDELGLTREDFPPVELVFGSGGIRDQIALCLKNQLEAIFGLSCTLRSLNWHSLFPKLINGAFQLGLVNWTPHTEDPITALNTFRYANDGPNISKWENKQFQHWLELSDQETCLERRASYLLSAEEELVNAIPVVPLFYQPSQPLVKQDLQPDLHHFFDVAKNSSRQKGPCSPFRAEFRPAEGSQIPQSVTRE